jgi:succinate dehydrogenase / fumarate reductase membrane anchor subunit
MTDKASSPAIMRSMLGRARGLGSARSGASTWWAERVTSLALIPLTLWFIGSVIHLKGMPRSAVAHWAANPLVATLLVALIVTTFHHMQMGLQVVIEDYIQSEKTKMASLLLMKGAVVLLGLAAVISALRLALAG